MRRVRPRPGRRRLARRPGFEARRLAVLALFESEFRPGSAEEALERLAAERAVGSAAVEHARGIVTGVAGRLPEIDARLAELAPEIPVSELGRVERAILRSGLYEVLYSAATQAGETIDDAVSLARMYAGEAARRLVNGVLGSASRSSGGGARR